MFMTVLSISLFVASLIAVPGMVIILAFGLLPTLVAYFVQTTRVRGAFSCMASMNMAGTVPVLMNLWQDGMGVDAALRLLGDIFMWGLMYGSAGLAVFLIWAAPVIVRTAFEIQARAEQTKHEKAQRKLIAEWGESIVKDSTSI